MTQLRSIALVIALALPAAIADAAESAPAPQPQVAAAVLSTEECAVWARELSFAQSVVDHDATAFAAHVHADAAFNSGHPQPKRGRELIVRDWGDIIAGKGLKLLWYPTRVTIGGAADVAWSSGPALFEHLAPEAEHRYSIGTFHSVWHRGADGVWRVLFDEGAGMKPADAAAVEAYHAGRRQDCPSA